MTYTAALFIALGCESPPREIQRKTVDPAAYALNRDRSIELQNHPWKLWVVDPKISLDRSRERILGDHRPLYLAEGRVQSTMKYVNTDQAVVRVTFELEDGTVLDSSEITVEGIPPGSTKAFSRVIPLLPVTDRKFVFNMRVVSIKTSPAETTDGSFKSPENQ
jgi:hypothetical protein